MKLVAAVGLTTFAAAAPGLLFAHVAPDPTENNRYLTVTPQADRVRLAYTIFYGESPGLRARIAMDLDGDSTISAEEAQAFGDAVAAEVAAKIEVTSSGAIVPFAWKAVQLGLGKKTTSDGSFSVDMVAEICLAHRDQQRVTLHDRFEVDKPGEGEMKLETSPGLEILRSGTGDATGQLQPKIIWEGNRGPLHVDGYTLEYRTSESAFRSDSPCEPAKAVARLARPPSRSPWLVAGATLAALLVAIAALWWRRRNENAPAE